MMGTEAPAPQGRGWLVALLWLLLLSAGTPGSWPVTSHAPAPAPDQAAAQEPGRPAGGTQRLAPGAVCGKPKVTGRIFGGRNVLAGQWPWQASLLYQRSHLCGAVLIDSLWLVSTAHCFLNKSHDPADYQVLLGSTQLYQHTQHTQEISLSRIIVHPDFEKRHPFGSDIVMLQLHLPLNFTPYIAPACLPSPGMQLSGNLSCWITGWGMLSEDKQLHSPFRLQEGKVGLVGNELCNVLYRQRLSKSAAYSVQDEMLCAGDFSTGKAICQPMTRVVPVKVCRDPALAGVCRPRTTDGTDPYQLRALSTFAHFAVQASWYLTAA
ncbi:putative serine protease 47 isoform X11 [Canis lupus familiaris]|uniref:putative serine protease 47 isoform X11 n=2 Tax=Canis lupus TaxID=9612 RepID=UPI0018F71ED6|nr:putative serine protease 47 isoform X11 [Canis lupus familiaris]